MLKRLFSYSKIGYNFVSSKMVSEVKIGTHNGTFHCDEVLACSMLKHLKPEYADAKIIRTRDMNILKDCDIVVDVGGVYDPKIKRFDHHQKSFSETMNSLKSEYPWNIKLSSAGLIYYHFGHQILGNILNLPSDSEEVKSIYYKLYEGFIQEVDAIDNGVEPSENEMKYKIHTHLSARVKHCNPAWNDPDGDEAKGFDKASKLVEDEFLSRVNFYGKIWLPARDVVKQAISNRKLVDSSGEIIEFTNGGCPWKEHLFDLEKSLNLENTIKFVIYTDLNSNWRVQCVSVSPFSFENRISLKEEWRGLRDEELSKISGISDCVFVHMSGFIGGNKTREGALKMAQECLKLEK